MIPWAPPTPQGSGASNRISELLLERGRAEADRAARSGQIWGNALQNVGQVAAGAVQQHGEQQQQRRVVEQMAKRDAALTAAIEGWDGQDPQALAAGLVKIAGPEGLKLAQGVMAFRKLGTEADEKEARVNFDTTLKTAAGLPYPLFERWYPGLREKLAPGGAKFLGWNPAEIPEQPSPEVHANLQALLKTQQPEAAGPKPGTFEAYVMGKYGQQPTPEQQLAARQEWERANDKPAAAPGVGTFEDYVTQKFGTRPTPQQIEQARKTYNQADDRPRVAPAAPPDDMPPEWRTGAARVSLAMPDKRRGAFNAEVNRLWTEGRQDELRDFIRQAAIEGENVDTKNQILGRGAMLASLEDTKALLKEMKTAGVPTGWITGNVEDLVRKLGKTTDPRYVSLANRLQGTLINYRRAATGAAFGDREGQSYAQMFPNYKNDLPVNLALIDGLEREARTYDAQYWKHKLGESGARLMGVMPGGAPRGGTAGAAPPKKRNPFR